MAKSYKVIVKAGNEQNQTIDVRQGAGDSGQPVRIKAQAGAKYQLQEGQRNHQNAPDFVKVRRQGKNLLITFEGETQPSLIIEDYYEVMPEGYNAVVGQAENGNFYEYIPEDPKASGLIPMLGDGAQAVSVALGGAEVSGAGAALGVLAFSPLLGLLGLGAAGGAAYLANRDKTTAAPVNNGNNTGDTSTYVGITSPGQGGTAGVITGTGEPGAVVTVRDVNNNIIGSTTVSATGAWSLTPTGPVATGTISASARDTNGNTANATGSNGSGGGGDRNNSSFSTIRMDAASDTGQDTNDGITNDTTWNFATADTPPVISSFSPADNATGDQKECNHSTECQQTL